ncbi:hypothetical protein BCV72DRAFT_219479 [Rhizopus microsporus var. microsporus]|uniref:Uncharacterized protein n=1 Tax=Rhizopus microsporus var. microsporus TaxID=86635 RepID=A0A1X0RIC8_RHIZD|nr:hypothetical protein BCV72DRAFT_219479 [Rhizopus microsporus var. microsporus]
MSWQYSQKISQQCCIHLTHYVLLFPHGTYGWSLVPAALSLYQQPQLLFLLLLRSLKMELV